MKQKKIKLAILVSLGFFYFLGIYFSKYSTEHNITGCLTLSKLKLYIEKEEPQEKVERREKKFLYNLLSLRLVRNPSGISQALSFVGDYLNSDHLRGMVSANLHSRQGQRNLAKIRKVLTNYQTNDGYQLPVNENGERLGIGISGLIIDAGNGTFYDTTLYISANGHIEFSADGNLDLEYSCWNTLKVLQATIVCYVYLVVGRDNIRKELIDNPDYPYEFYLITL